MPKSKSASSNKLKIKKEHVAATALGLGAWWYWASLIAGVAVLAGSLVAWQLYKKSQKSK